MRVDLWQLPQVLSVTVMKSHYDDPFVQYVGGQRLEYQDVVEIWIQMSGPLPIRALSAALFVGETPVEYCEPLSENQYRFLAFDLTSLQPGAPISIGWPQAPEQKLATGFQFQLPSA